MGLRSWLGLGVPAASVPMAAERSIAQFSIGYDELPFWALNANTAAGPRVTREQALTVTAVLKARNLIAGTISTLPVRTVDPALRPVDVPLFRQIDPDVPNSVTMAMTVEDLLFEALSWWQVLSRGYDGFPLHCRHVSPHNVTFQMPGEFPVNRLPSGYYPGSHIFLLNTLEAVPVGDIIRFDSPNPPLLVAAARTIRRSLKHEMAADNYADNPQAREYFTPADDADPSDEPDPNDPKKRSVITQMLDAWAAARRRRSTGWVPAAFKLNQVEQMSPADLQMTQLIDRDARDIANATGLDPEDLGVSTTSRTYQNAVDRRQDRVNECYGPYMQAIEDRLSMDDITKRGHLVYLWLGDFLKANPVDEAAVNKTYIDTGVLIDDEVRADLRRPALTPEQRRMRTPAPLAPPRPEHSNVDQPAAPATPGLATVTQLRPTAGGFADDHAVAARFDSGLVGRGLVFDMSDVAAAFSVNEAKRTITGLVMPWGKVGRSDGRRWKFAPNSLQFDAGQLSRMKLYNDHVMSASVGRAMQTWSDEIGQWARFKVARGPDGDKALALAADGVKDGFSAGVGYAGADHGMTFADDPDGAGDVIYVTSAPWRETSLVANPAFDDARISAVSMSADPTQGVSMDCSICGQKHAAGTACPQAPASAPTTTTATAVVPQPAPAAATYSADQVAAMFAALNPVTIPPVAGAQPVNVDKLVEDKISAALVKFAAENPPPAVVNPVRPGELAQVTEQPLYRFDGGRGQRCFSSDLAKVMDKDPETKAIMDKYMAEDMAVQFANITPANVAALNPVPTRPELYVPNLSFPRPLGSLVTTGVLDSLIAFIVPQFASSSGLAQTHTTGTEPTQGAVAVTQQTITPKGISGRVDLDREIIDSGGSPQADQIIFGEMARSWYDVLEERIVDMFQALSLTDTNIVGTNGDLQTALTTLFATFQFIRGGDRFSSFGLNQDLYTAIVNAVDEMGRPLFPMVGAQNSDGSVSPDLSQVRVASKVGLPSWALASGNGGPDRSFLWAPSNVYQWASAPKRFNFDQVNVSSVGIAIWGYSAEATTRATDVYQLDYSQS